jgi:hypothetical protein
MQLPLKAIFTLQNLPPKYLQNIYDYAIVLLALAIFSDATRNRNNPICVAPLKVTKASTVVIQVLLLPAVMPM